MQGEITRRVRIRAMSSFASDLRQTVARVREQMARAAERSGRRGEEITLVAVSKTHPANRIHELFDAGVRHFGENRVQEWESKAPHLARLDAVWHMIGHVQKNKAARAAALFHSVDSLDSIALALRLDRARQELAPPAETGNLLRILVEVKLDPQP